MNTQDVIKKQVTGNKVVLYMKGTPDFPQCGFSARTVAALRAVNAQFAYVNIFEDPEIREGLKTYSNWPTFPQLYVNGELVGGCDITLELYQSGELAKMIAEASPAQGAAGSAGATAAASS
jgi:monothiol glutaredoxin